MQAVASPQAKMSAAEEALKIDIQNSITDIYSIIFFLMFNKIFGGYDNLWKAIIRPPREDY